MNAAFSVISFLLSVSLQEEISYRTISPIHFFSFLLYPSSLFFSTTFISTSYQPPRWVSFIGYIRNLAPLNITKKRGFMWQIHKYFIHNNLLI